MKSIVLSSFNFIKINSDKKKVGISNDIYSNVKIFLFRIIFFENKILFNNIQFKFT